MLSVAFLVLTLAQGREPLYASSVVDTDFDFIRETDRSVLDTVAFVEKGPAEMPDKVTTQELFQPAYQFRATYKDGVKVDFFVSERAGTQSVAQNYVDLAAIRLGRIPHVLRKGVNRVVINEGDATAFSDIGLIVLYTKNMGKRISTHDLEETIFHESVHATWDKDHAEAPGWTGAQRNDPGFLTNYGRSHPKGEDLAETALFAVTMIHHPDRLPADVRARVQAQVPARLEYIRKLFPAGTDWHGPAGKL